MDRLRLSERRHFFYPADKVFVFAEWLGCRPRRAIYRHFGKHYSSAGSLKLILGIRPELATFPMIPSASPDSVASTMASAEPSQKGANWVGSPKRFRFTGRSAKSVQNGQYRANSRTDSLSAIEKMSDLSGL